ncbi:hypothetical protein Tco_1104744 [Tanacetum coccineum]
MRTRSQSRNSNRQQQQVNPTFVVPFNLVEPIPVVTMDDNRTMAQLLEAPTVGYEDAIVVPEITADNFELKHGLCFFPFSLRVQQPEFGLKRTPSTILHMGSDLVSKIPINKFFSLLPKQANLQNEITRFPQRFDEHFLRGKNRSMIFFEHKYVRSSSTPILLPLFAELKDMVKALLLEKKNQTQAPTPVKAVEESCVTCGGAYSYQNCPATDGNVYHDNIQEFVSQATTANFNQGNTGYRAPIANQIRPPGFPLIQQNQGNNQNRYNQNRGNNYNQSQIYRPLINQPPVYQAPPYQAPAPQTQGVTKTDFESYVKANDAAMRNMQDQNQNLQNQMINLTDMLSKFVNSNTHSTSSLRILPIIYHYYARR